MSGGGRDAKARGRVGAELPEVEAYRGELLDRIFLPFVIAGFLAVCIGCWRAIGDGQWVFAAVYLGLYAIGVGVAVVHRGGSVRRRSMALLSALFLIATAGLVRLGLGGVGTLVLVGFCGLTALLRGVRAAFWAVGMSLAVIGGVGYAMIEGYIVLPPERALTSVRLGAWISVAATFAAMTVGLIVPLQAVSARLAETLRGVARQARAVERSNEQLRDQVRRREQAEEALRTSERRYRDIFESASVGMMEEDASEVRDLVARWRREGIADLRAHLESNPELVAQAAARVTILDVNQAALDIYGASSKQELLESLDSIFAPESWGTFREVLVALAEGTSHFRGEAVNQTLRGERIHVLIHVAIPERLDASVLVSVLDITDRKRLERSLAEARKMEAIGTLAGGIAHDFNNLLMGIRGYATLLRRPMAPSGRERAYVETIDQLVDSGAALTRQLLGFARRGKYDVQTTDLGRLLDGSLSIFGRAKKEIQTRCRWADDLWTIDVDRSQLEQVLLNLYVNAWQAMPEGGELAVAADNVTLAGEEAETRGLPAGDYVRISVRDTGVGMDPSVLARVFEPFFTTKGLSRGTGLGLASAYAIVKNHGGVLEAISAPGEGSTFLIHLPASKKPVVTPEVLAADATTGDETVLLVDDEPALLRSTTMMLEELGYRVHPAADGHQALELFDVDRRAIAVVVLDMIMPGMGGPEVFEQLRARSADVPILLLSGYSQDDRADGLLKNGPSAFLQKPFRLSTLSRKLRELIDGRSASS